MPTINSNSTSSNIWAQILEPHPQRGVCQPLWTQNQPLISLKMLKISPQKIADRLTSPLPITRHFREWLHLNPWKDASNSSNLAVLLTPPIPRIMPRRLFIPSAIFQDPLVQISLDHPAPISLGIIKKVAIILVLTSMNRSSSCSSPLTQLKLMRMVLVFLIMLMSGKTATIGIDLLLVSWTSPIKNQLALLPCSPRSK